MKVKGRRTYLYRAVGSRGKTIDFLLSAQRYAEAAKRFFRIALAQPHTVNPRTITVDRNAAYLKAAAEMKRNGELWRRSRLRQVCETIDQPWAWLWQFLDSPTNDCRL